MIDAAYYRRQAATCRSVAAEFRQPGPLLDLAHYFERLAAQADAPAAASARGVLRLSLGPDRDPGNGSKEPRR